MPSSVSPPSKPAGDRKPVGKDVSREQRACHQASLGEAAFSWHVHMRLVEKSDETEVLRKPEEKRLDLVHRARGTQP